MLLHEPLDGKKDEAAGVTDDSTLPLGIPLSFIGMDPLARNGKSLISFDPSPRSKGFADAGGSPFSFYGKTTYFSLKGDADPIRVF